MTVKKIIIDFLKKYFFILKAASDGWRISYIGGNQYKFYNNLDKSILQNTYNTNDFLSKYTS